MTRTKAFSVKHLLGKPTEVGLREKGKGKVKIIKTEDSGVLLTKGSEKWSGHWRGCQIKEGLIDRVTPDVKFAKTK